MPNRQLKTNIILIDFENVQPANLPQLRGGNFKIRIFVGAHQKKLPIGTVLGIHPLGPDASSYILIQGTGRNALDFHIAYYVGRLSMEFPGASFHIISKDTGFDPLIEHLKANGVSCHRWPALELVAGMSPSTPDAAVERWRQAWDKLGKLGASRPRKLKTLKTTVKALLGNGTTDEEASQVIEEFVHHHKVAILASKVTYPASQAVAPHET